MKKLLAALIVVLSLVITPAANALMASKRVILYYQTQFNGSTYVSPLGLTRNNTGVTQVIVGAVHLNQIGGQFAPVHLNDHPPADARFRQMWADLKTMQGQGVQVLAMVGGAAPGSFTRLDTEFSRYYPLLRDMIRTFGLNGVDLDVEERMSLAGVERVIDALRADFGSGFVITLAPVATALSGGGNLSGFNYEQLYRDRAGSIAWFNAQMYNGWGSVANTSSYDRIISRGLIPADKILAGALTNPGNGGSGYVAPSALQSTIRSLIAKYPTFGGVDGWEYFNSMPGGTAAPWQWASAVSSAMR
jgi:chitinase